MSFSKKMLFGIACAMILLSCGKMNKPVNDKENKSTSIESKQESEIRNTLHEADSTLELVNDCKNRLYEAKLEEYIHLDSNAFLLTILLENGDQLIRNLDLPSGLSKIEKCSEHYVLLSSACGGPCYGNDFVFLDDKRKTESYMYCHIVPSDEFIISHIENEEFEKLRIRNLMNGKEIVVDISNCEDLNTHPCDILSMKLIRKKLILEFDSSGDTPKRKSVAIDKILN